MKNLSIFIFLIGVFLSACSEEDLELRPQQSLSNESAFLNADGAEGVLFGTYNLLQDLHVYGSQPQIVADYVTDNVNFVGSFTNLQDLNIYAYGAANGTVEEVWRDTYEAILATNAIIANSPNIEDPALTEERLDRILGEAYFIRANCYFLLANYYGQPYQFNGGSNLAVPLVLEPFSGEVILYERSTLNEVHAQIESDLAMAQDLLPDFIEQGRGSSVAATALLSRLKLYRGEWQEAADLANEVMNSGVHSLAPDYSFYNSVSPEIIFSIENTVIDPQNEGDPGDLDGGSWDSYYEGAEQGGRGDCAFSMDLMQAFESEAGDLRYDLKEQGQTFSGPLATFTTKYDDGATNTSDYAVIRYSEMLMNRAEALAELNGVNQESIDLVNQIRSRAGLTNWTTATFATATEFLDAIAEERRKEFAFEGHRRMDLLRRNQPLRTSSNLPESVLGSDAGVGVSVGDDFAIWPIPQAEREVNPNLEQNPGF